jgi:retron-type reverse transcriptase
VILAAGDFYWIVPAAIGAAVVIGRILSGPKKPAPPKTPLPPLPNPTPPRPTGLTPGQLNMPAGGLTMSNAGPAQPVQPTVPANRPIPAIPLPQPVPRAQPAQPAKPAPAAPRQNKALDLDPGQFAAISSADAKAQALAAGNALHATLFQFGRRSVIPPADDPRTKIIDRAMVGQGLITPEELADIHKAGEEMAAARPQLPDAATTARRAVEEADAEKKARKEQKKAAAAERKRLHAEAVKHRRDTDIIFLGRGVSTGLADRRSNVEKLAAAGIPVLATPADVATAMSLSIKRLRWLAFHSEAAGVTHYIRFTIPKRSGGVRTLFAPHDNIAAAQRWVLENILNKVPVHAAAHGFVTGRSTVSNAAAHVKRDVLVNADLTDFFPTITFPRVRGIFKQLGYSPAVATVLALLCTESPRRVVEYAGKTFHVATGPRALPQGACTSPALSNLASRRMDSRLAGIAGKLGWNYTRYADDLSFSATGEASKRVGYLLARIRHITADERFTVNERKTRILRQSDSQTVTGIVVNDRPGVPRDTVRRLRAILHRAKSEGLAAQNRDKLPHFEAWLRGMIAYVEMVNPKQAAPLRAVFEVVKR